MSLISENILREFSAWAEENEDKRIFPGISKEETSYYINRDSEKTYMMKYSFETMAELEKALEEYSGLSDDLPMLRKLTIGVLQNRFNGRLEVQEAEGQNRTEDGNKALPDFVYVF